MRVVGSALVTTLLLLFAASAIAQEPSESDSTTVVHTTTAADSASAEQRISLGSLEDSIKVIFPDVNPDTLNENQRMLVEFETRFRLKQRDEKVSEQAPDQFSFHDSLIARFVSGRKNLRGDIDRSFYHDAGDYLRSDPAFFVLEPQGTPMRKTVQPYGLRGNRLAVFHGSVEFTPFEHIVQPDGMLDLNDIPTALDDQVAILPGPVGLLFGARHSVATLVTTPKKPDGYDPESAFLVDKGSFGYSYARGRFSKRFVAGRSVDLSIGYRNADGPYLGSDDDAYHDFGSIFYPVGQNQAIEAEGWLYDRRGRYLVEPDAGGSRYDRNRVDRSAKVAFVSQNDERTSRLTAGYTYLRQTSDLDENYVGRFNHTGHGIVVAREWMSSAWLFKSEARGNYLKYDDVLDFYERYSGQLAVTGLTRFHEIDLGLFVRQEYVESFRLMPSVSVTAQQETDKTLWSLGASYSERAPSLHELNSRPRRGSLSGGLIDYADEGNPGLGSEKLAMGNAEFEFGTLSDAVNLSATGGKVIDGINWISDTISDPSLTEDLTRFRPVNSDIDFFTLAGTGRLKLWNFLSAKAGGSYHHLEQEGIDQIPYSPEFQSFIGAELQIFWPQKLIRFFAYGEMTYTSKYSGYSESNLGNAAIFNTKLSFQLGHFRFHWIVQNSFFNLYGTRDFYTNAGRYSSYGFIWNFLN